MIRFLIFFILFISGFCNAQTDAFILKSKVKKDTVLLRWAPTAMDLLLTGLRNGFVIQRIEGEGSFDANPTLKEIPVLPFEDRKAAYMNSSNEEVQHMTEFLTDLLATNSLTEEAEKMTFAVLLLGSSTNRELSSLLGLCYEDVRANSTTYTYRVILKNTDSKSNPVTVSTMVFTVDKNMTTLSGSARPKLKEVYLTWEAASLQADYVAYWIERSTDSIHYSQRNALPYFFLKSPDEPNKTLCDYVDTAVAEGMTYYYRVTGIDHFAESGKSTNSVRVYVPKSIYGEVHIDSIKAHGFERHISGTFISHRNQNEIEKWMLLRSDSLLFGYTFVAEQKYAGANVQFIANVPIENGDRYHYKLVAVGADNDTVYSYPFYFFTLDQVPPAVPEGLTGIVSDSGIVTLRWNANPDKDLRGYRVYRSNALKEEFVEVSPVFSTAAHFSDTLTLRTLTNEVYYCISAVDLNYNNSKTCMPVKLLKPDILPPVAAVFKFYTVDSAGISLAWNNSSSADVSQHSLVRQNEFGTDTLLRWSDTTMHYNDTSGIPGKSYYYSILTTDFSKNTTQSTKLFVNYETGIRKGVSAIKIASNRIDKRIELTWQLPDEEIYSIQIYRAKNDGSFMLYKTLRGPTLTSFSDQNPAMNNTYHYKLKVVYKNGISSVLSEVVTITY